MSIKFTCFRLIQVFPLINLIKLRNTKMKNKGILYRTLIDCTGNCNTIIVEDGTIMRHSIIHINGNDNVIHIGKNVVINSGELWIEDSQNCINIGDETRIAGKTHIACTEGKSVSIGERCLFSSDIVIRTGDSHVITDMDGNRINNAESVVINDHVWICNRVIICKGVKISSNTVVGAGAVVTKQFDDENVILSGVPAIVKKKNINWRDSRLDTD